MKAVIFDRDGVILDSESTNIKSAVKTFLELGIKIKDNEKNLVIGRHPADYKEFFLKNYDFSYEKFIKIQKRIYHKLLESTPLFHKTISLIKKLHKLKIPLALTTSAGFDSTSKVLKKSDLENVFNVIITSANCSKRKPDPEPYRVTAEKLNLNPVDCVAIEDSQIGVESAKNAGMKCIALPNEYTRDQDFSRADVVVDSADKINFELLN